MMMHAWADYLDGLKRSGRLSVRGFSVISRVRCVNQAEAAQERRRLFCGRLK